jgi:hypothetical protein
MVWEIRHVNSHFLFWIWTTSRSGRKNILFKFRKCDQPDMFLDGDNSTANTHSRFDAGKMRLQRQKPWEASAKSVSIIAKM